MTTLHESRMDNLSSSFPPQGLYAITSERYRNTEQLAAAVAAAVRGGARVVQYRAKAAADPVGAAERLLATCRAARVPLIVNDDVALARRIGADGVHLGRDDTPLAEARRVLGSGAIIGVSCYDSVERAARAEGEGADYVAFGRFFPSKTKPGAPCARLETLGLAKERLRVPIVAIGGITAENGGILLEAGADLLAVIDGVFGGNDPEGAALEFQALFSRSERGASDGRFSSSPQ
jgi:thiamine-phosphate pyrophosphorylase